MKQVVLFYMWNFLIKLVKEFYKKCPFWHHETKKLFLWQLHRKQLTNPQAQHSSSLFFPKVESNPTKDNCFKIKIAKICAFH